MYWLSIPTTVDTTKHPYRYVEYWITRDFVAAVEPKAVANSLINNKLIIANIDETINDTTIDVVKKILLSSTLNSAFLFKAIICPPSPNNHSKTVASNIIGSKRSIAATACLPINVPTKNESTTELMFSAITISSVGNNNSLNLLSAILKFISLHLVQSK